MTCRWHFLFCRASLFKDICGVVEIVVFHHLDPALIHEGSQLVIHRDLAEELVAELICDLLDMAVTEHTDLFAAIAPICGGGMPWNAGVLDMPVWAFHGSADLIVLPSNSDDMVSALKALGKDVKYTRMDGVGHDVWVHAYNADLVTWLLDKKKN